MFTGMLFYLLFKVFHTIWIETPLVVLKFELFGVKWRCCGLVVGVWCWNGWKLVVGEPVGSGGARIWQALKGSEMGREMTETRPEMQLFAGWRLAARWPTQVGCNSRTQPFCQEGQWSTSDQLSANRQVTNRSPTLGGYNSRRWLFCHVQRLADLATG